MREPAGRAGDRSRAGSRGDHPATHTCNTEPYYIRRQLTEGAVRAADKRAQFVGVDTYEAAGGLVMRDLFEHDDGGWLQDPALLDRLVIERLQAQADARQHARQRRALAVRGLLALPPWRGARGRPLA